MSNKIVGARLINSSKKQMDEKFVDAVIKNDEVLYKYFIEHMSEGNISLDLNMDIKEVHSYVVNRKRKLNVIYDIYLKTGCDKELLDEMLKVRLKEKYVSDIVDLYNKGKHKPLKYIRFTEHYFPELSGKLGNASDRYYSFVDEIVERKIIMKQYFEDGQKAKDISSEMGKDEAYVDHQLYNMKDHIRHLYSKYIRIYKEKLKSRS